MIIIPMWLVIGFIVYKLISATAKSMTAKDFLGGLILLAIFLVGRGIYLFYNWLAT